MTSLPEITSAERAVADLLPIGADPEEARRVLARVPLWFHTFALNAERGLYTPGVARDHRYRVPFLPASFAGQRVLDVGTFDGFYAYLAEHRGATRVVAVDNEQYTAWVRARWGVVLKGGEGFRAIGALLGSRVQYVRGDALTLRDTGERFDVIFCFGILHRVENPLGLMRALGERLAPGGRLLVETYGIARDGRVDERAIEVQQPGGIYPGDEFVYWGFGAGGLTALAGLAGFAEAWPGSRRRGSRPHRRSTGIRAYWAHSCVPARDRAPARARRPPPRRICGRPLVTASGRAARRRLSSARPSRSSRASAWSRSRGPRRWSQQRCGLAARSTRAEVVAAARP